MLMRLLEPTRMQLWTLANCSHIKWNFSKQRANERGLTRAIWPDDSNAVARLNGDGQILEEQAIAKSFLQVLAHRNGVANARTLGQRKSHGVKLDWPLNQTVFFVTR